MKCLALCFLLITSSQFAHANRRVSVDELNLMLTAQHAAHISDAESAKQLEGLELTQRLTQPVLQRIVTANAPGPQVTQFLELLADTSTFLDPPANEFLPEKPAPDFKGQLSMVSAAVDFVAVTLQHLPDFIVSRNTRSFDNVSTNLTQSGELFLTRMHLVNSFSRQVAYRDGREVIEDAKQGKPRSEAVGLQTWGEFGPILATVLRDVIKGHVTWSHWETAEDGKVLANFSYSVPKSASHYRLNYCCTFNGLVRAPTSDYRDTPAYHGSLSLDPESGAIRRITVEADVTETDVIERAAIAVEYGDVSLGGKTYICPLRSLAYSVDHYHPGMRLLGPITRINEVRFMDYHKFGSSSRILAEAPVGPPIVATSPGASEPSQAPTGPIDLGASSIASSSPRAHQKSADGSTSRQISNGADSMEQPPESAASRGATGAPLRDIAAGSLSSESHPPVRASMDEPPTLKMQSQDVLVDVVVTQKNGQPVLNLTRKDFVVKEDGKTENTDFFEAHLGNDSGISAPNTTETPLPNQSETTSAAPLGSSGGAIEIILLDMLNSSTASQRFVHEKLSAFFKNMKPNTRIALFALGSELRCVQGVTSDSSLLIRAFNDKASHLFPQKIEASWNRDDDLEGEAEINRLKKVGVQSSEAVRSALDELAATKRREQMAMTLQALDDLAQNLSGIPGRKNLLWFADTFPIRLSPIVSSDGEPSVSTNHSPATDTMIQKYDDKLKEVSHKLTTARVAVYPIQAEGVSEEHIFEANLASPGSQEENLSIRRANPDAASKGRSDGDWMSFHKKASQERADTIIAMEQLATETGGKAFFNTNALDQATTLAIANGSSYYTIGYSPSNKNTDGHYRRIELTVRGNYALAYRRGYYADSEAASPVRPEPGSKGGSSQRQ